MPAVHSEVDIGMPMNLLSDAKDVNKYVKLFCSNICSMFSAYIIKILWCTCREYLKFLQNENVISIRACCSLKN